jgi:hypothetical protein
LRRPVRRADAGVWRDVVPPVFTEKISDSDALKAHRALYKRVEAAAAKVTKLEAAHARALQEDKAAEATFATKGGKLPPPVGPDAQLAVEQARRELQLLERELPASADRVFEAAHPHAEDALRQIEGLLDQDADAIEATVGEALRLLDERAQLGREQNWLSQALWESILSPFDARTRAVSNSRTAVELRQALSTLKHERQETARRRHEAAVERVMLFHEDRSPKPAGGRSLSERRMDAERIVREREAAGR